MKMNTNLLAVCAGAAFVILSGCTSQNSQAGSPDQMVSADKITDKKPGDVPNSYVKPGAAITFTHNYDGQSKPGEIENFVVNVHEEYAAGDLTVNISADDGLDINFGGGQHSFSMADNADQVINVSVSASSPGRYYLNFQAAANSGNGQVLRRSYAIAIQVGDKSFNTKPSEGMNIQQTESGENIIIMDAEETIQ